MLVHRWDSTCGNTSTILFYMLTIKIFIMRHIIFLLTISLFLLSCEQNDTKQKELELKEKELGIKEKELLLKEKEFIKGDSKKNIPDTLNKSLTNQNNASKLLQTIKYEGSYIHSSSFSTANNSYPGEEKLVIKKTADGTYKWTIEEIGYQTHNLLHGTGKMTGETVEFYLAEVKEGGDYLKEYISNTIPYFVMKKEGKKTFTKFRDQEKFINYYTK